MIILGLDLGTSTGWAVMTAGGGLRHCGLWDLSGSRFEGGGMRFLRFRAMLAEVVTTVGVDAIAFEEVRSHSSAHGKGPRTMNVTAAHVYGGLLATLSSFGDEHDVPYTGIPVGTIKRVATGRGNANKQAVIDAARARWGAPVKDEDDVADAIWCAECLRLDLRL